MAGLTPADHASPTGTNIGERERIALVESARVILANCGVSIGHGKVNRLVRTFRSRVERNGFEFFEFLANTVQLDTHQRRAALANPDVARAIAYCDPTGETAVHHVLKERGW